jgi:hypothetical protein
LADHHLADVIGIDQSRGVSGGRGGSPNFDFHREGLSGATGSALPDARDQLEAYLGLGKNLIHDMSASASE